MKQLKPFHADVSKTMIDIIHGINLALERNDLMNFDEIAATRRQLEEAHKIRDYDYIITYFDYAIQMQNDMRNFLSNF